MWELLHNSSLVTGGSGAQVGVPGVLKEENMIVFRDMRTPTLQCT